MNALKRTLKNVYRTYIDVISYVKTDSKRFNIDTNMNNGDKEKEGNDDDKMDVDHEEVVI